MLFALGGDLLARAIEANPGVLMVSGGVEYAAIQFRRRISASDITFWVELSLDLLDWSGTTVAHPVSDNGDGTEIVTIRAVDPMSGEGSQFFRVRVSLN